MATKTTKKLQLVDSYFSANKVAVTYFGVPYESAETVYDISAARDGSVKLYLFRNSDGKYDGVVRGAGAMREYAEDSRPYPVDQIARLYIEAGVTSIGAYFMYGGYVLQDLSFADSTAIAHLGAYAFAKCLFDGEYDFSGLTDKAIECVFMGCARLEGLTLSSTITTIKGDEAFRNCFALRYVEGLTGLTKITGQATFYNCTSLEELEVTPKNVTLGTTTFVHVPGSAVISGTTTPLYKANWGNIGSDCFVQNMWTEEQLTAIRATKGEKTNVLPMPAYDAQTDEFYGTYPLTWFINEDYCLKGSAQNGGCGHFSLFHIYNAMHPDAQYPSFREFVEKLILPRKITVTQEMHDFLSNDAYGKRLIAANSSVSYEVGSEITAYDLPHTSSEGLFTADYTAYWGVIQALGWTATKTLASDIANGVSNMKQNLINTIMNNEPVFITLHSRRSNSSGGHAAAVIGYNADTDRFLIVDSSDVLPSKYLPVCHWVDIEAFTAPAMNKVGEDAFEVTYILTFDFGEVVTMSDIDNKLDALMEQVNSGYHTEPGTFTPDSDLNAVNISCEPGAKHFTLIAADVNSLSPATSSRMPIRVISSSDFYQNFGEKGGSYVEFNSPRSDVPIGATVCPFDNSNGIRIQFTSEAMVLEKDKTYNWTAYYWNDTGSSLPPEQVIVNDELVMD